LDRDRKTADGEMAATGATDREARLALHERLRKLRAYGEPLR
jgi:hypothetical protein